MLDCISKDNTLRWYCCGYTAKTILESYLPKWKNNLHTYLKKWNENRELIDQGSVTGPIRQGC